MQVVVRGVPRQVNAKVEVWDEGGWWEGTVTHVTKQRGSLKVQPTISKTIISARLQNARTGLVWADNEWKTRDHGELKSHLSSLVCRLKQPYSLNTLVLEHLFATWQVVQGSEAEQASDKAQNKRKAGSRGAQPTSETTLSEWRQQQTAGVHHHCLETT